MQEDLEIRDLQDNQARQAQKGRKEMQALTARQDV